MNSSLRLLALALLAGCASVPPPATQFEIVGYYAGWKGLIELEPSQVTVVNYAFLDICWDEQHGNPATGPLRPCQGANGAVVLDRPAIDAPNIAYLGSLRAANPRFKLVAAVGGWTRSNRFSDMAADPRTRENFVRSVVAFLRENRWDGIDIDWEYPGSIGLACAPGNNDCDRATDKANFVALAKELRAALEAAGAAQEKHYIFTIAAGADREFVFDNGSSAWLVELSRHLDWINLMTYDYHGTWESAAGFVAPLLRDAADPAPSNADASVALYLAQGIAPRQLTLGMPFYGKGWIGCARGPRGDGLYQSCAGPIAEPAESTFEFAYLAEKGYLRQDAAGRYTIGGLGFTRYWNDAARVPYLYNTTSGIFVSYDDEDSIRDKSLYVIAKGLRGAMFWELNADRRRVLGRVVAEELRRIP